MFLDQGTLEGRLARLPASRLALCLTKIGWEITLMGRDAYALETKGFARLRTINESEHVILGFVERLLSEQELNVTYVAAYLVELSQANKLGSRVRAAVTKAVAETEGLS